MSKRVYMRKNVLEAILIMMLFIFFYGTTSKAAEEVKCIEQVNWLDDSAYNCLRVAGMDMEKDYYLSQQFSICRELEADDKLCLVFCDDKCIGELWVNEPMESCAFYQMNCEDITNLYINEIAISLVSPDKDHIYAIRNDNNSSICLYGVCEDDNADRGLISTSFDSIVLHPLMISCSLENRTENREFIDDHFYLDVPIVRNAASPDTNEGLCWVACILSMTDYRFGTSGYNTVGLYNYIKYSFDPVSYGIPSGTDTWIGRAYNLLYYSASYVPNGLCFNDVESAIDVCKPIHADISDSVYAHSVVVCGYSRYSSTGANIYYSYRLMDPNIDTSYVVATTSGTGTNFTYGTYNQWYSSFY